VCEIFRTTLVMMVRRMARSDFSVMRNFALSQLRVGHYVVGFSFSYLQLTVLINMRSNDTPGLL
jgi:hypothetical protein